jgi:hypothetical protein
MPRTYRVVNEFGQQVSGSDLTRTEAKNWASDYEDTYPSAAAQVQVTRPSPAQELADEFGTDISEWEV